MNRRFLRLLPVFVAALWLPFQAVAATAMPFCRHGDVQTAPVPADAVVGHCHLQEQAPPAPADRGLNCDDCGACHLLAAGFIPTAERAPAIVAVAQDYRAEVPLAPASATPEPPRQPPKRLA